MVINAAAPHRTRLDDLLRHEMTHASSMPGSGFDPAAWWLVEGVAELAATGGAPTSQYDGLADVRRFVREQRLERSAGHARGGAATRPTGRWPAAYGIGYIAVRHLADRFGEPDVLAFLEAVVHNGRSPGTPPARCSASPGTSSARSVSRPCGRPFRSRSAERAAGADRTVPSMLVGEPIRLRRQWYVVTGMAMAALLVAGVAPAALLAGDAARPAAAAAPAPSSSPSPAATAGPSERDFAATAHDAITDVLSDMSVALRRDDRAAFLAVAAPGNKAVAGELRRRFASLRALRVAEFNLTIESHVIRASGAGNGGEWTAMVAVDHCFGSLGCTREQVSVKTRWQLTAGGARLVRIGTWPATTTGRCRGRSAR